LTAKIKDMAYTQNPYLPKVRQEAADLVSRGWSTRKVGRRFGIGSSTVSKWVKKAKRYGYHPIPTLSSRPKHHPKELSGELVWKIFQKRLVLKRSSEVVHKELLNEGTVVSVSSVKRTLDRSGLLKKRSPWKRHHTSLPRPDVTRQGDLVQVDTIHLLTPEGHRIYVFTLLDVYSRWAYARAYARANTRTALAFVGRAQQEAPFTFRTLQSDHGSEFSQNFTERIKITHRHSRVRRPNDNAHLERFNRTIQEECLDKVPRTIRALNSALRRYVPYYNEKRLHFGIDLRAPRELLTNCVQAID
jgi:transposase InsO family protein